jgi:hypothetical protein
VPVKPKVSFVIPCYKLAHLLRECVDSILSQTYADFEILIMDDCSPDNTVEVAQSYHDPRIKHVRNEPNLGHLLNYNKGIRMAQGKYVWLISADDRLRSTRALERYVAILEANANVGYVFCPAVALVNGQEGRIIHSHGPEDNILGGRDFLKSLLNANSVVAASGFARKECYDAVSYFPLDMPWGGDWYLWCVYALHYDVAYVAEPLVNYRTHELSMTTLLTTTNPRACTQDDTMLHWRVKDHAEQVGCPEVVAKCREMIAYEYSRNIVGEAYEQTGRCMTLSECEDALVRLASGNTEWTLIRGLMYACLGDRHTYRRESAQANRFYRKALKYQPFKPKIWAKYALSLLGGAGRQLRTIAHTTRDRWQETTS